jgi:hypothetical protein
MHGYAPFGLQVSYTTEGVGSGLVFTRNIPLVAEGRRAAFYNDAMGAREVAIMHVAGSARRDGVLWYFNTNTQTMSQQTYPGHALVGPAVLVLPFLGNWVQVLTHPVGVMALLGSPLVMLLVDMFMLAMRWLRGRRFLGFTFFNTKVYAQ